MVHVQIHHPNLNAHLKHQLGAGHHKLVFTIGPTVLVMLQHQVHTLISCCCYQYPRDGHVCQVCARDDKVGKDKLIHKLVSL